MVSIGSNILAMRTIRRVSEASSAFGRSVERLGSGLRINRASDDPAGLAVSSTLGSRARVLARAKLNLSDGISLLNIADSAAGSVSALLTRMAELAEQSANGTFSASQRQSLDTEYQALDQEIRRISSTTTFNGVGLSSGTLSSRATKVIGTNSLTSTGALSSDGRFQIFVSAAGNSIQWRDGIEGTTRSISTNSGVTVDKVHVLNNGDVVYVETSGTAADVFYYSNSTRQSRQITRSATGGDINEIAVSDDGSKIAVLTDTAYTNGGTIQNSRTLNSGNYELAIFETSTGIISTNGVTVNRASSQLTFSANGRFLAFKSKGDWTGGNPGGEELYGVDLSNRTPSIRQLTTNSSNINGVAGVTDDGTVLFSGNDNYAGQNPSSLLQFFSADIHNGALRQVTSGAVDFQVINYAHASRDGHFIVFESAGNFTGENSRGLSQVFRLDLLSGKLQQQTAFSSEVSMIDVSGDGSTALTWDGPTGNFGVIDTTRADSQFDFEAGDGAAGRIVASAQTIFGAVRGLGVYTLLSSTSAKVALDQVSRNIQNLAALRGTFGASLSRLQAGSEVTASQLEGTLAARARIQDIDVASESAELTRNSILQQVSAAVLAQARNAPAVALRLLQS